MDICKEVHDRKGNYTDGRMKLRLKEVKKVMSWEKTQEEKVQVEMTGSLHCFLCSCSENSGRINVLFKKTKQNSCTDYLRQTQRLCVRTRVIQCGYTTPLI